MEQDGESNFKGYTACGFMPFLLKTPDGPINHPGLLAPAAALRLSLP